MDSVHLFLHLQFKLKVWKYGCKNERVEYGLQPTERCGTSIEIFLKLNVKTSEQVPYARSSLLTSR